MQARKVAAQFAAYAWYEENREGRRSRNEAARFATENWKSFVPVAPEGLGRLLLKIAAGQSSPQRRKPLGERELAVADELLLV